MENMNKLFSSMSGGFNTVKQDFIGMAKEMRELLRLFQGFGGGGGGGGQVMTSPSFSSFGGQQPVSTLSLFGPAAQATGAGAFAALKASLPGAGTAVTTDAAISYMKFYAGMGGSQTQNLLYGMNQRGLATSRTDAVNALLEAQKYGFTGQPNFSQITRSFEDVSRLVPGAGLAGGAQVMGTLNQARSVNMMRSLGIQVRDPFTGKPKSFSEIGDEIYRMIQNGLGRAPTRADINSSLLPGYGLYNFLNDLFGGDELTKNAIRKYLLQKASGGDLSYESLRNTGAVTATQQRLGEFQGQLGITNVRSAPGLSGLVATGADFGTFLVEGIDKLIAILQELAGSLNIGNGSSIEGLAGGGPMKANRPYLVGEKGPELVVPKDNATVIPNGQSSLKSILEQAGFSGRNLEIAMAVAYAESGGNAMNFNPINRDLSYGLFQINMKDDDPKSPFMGRNRRKQYGITNEDLFDPATNARIAYEISSKGKDWSPWATYNEGTYMKYLGKDYPIKYNNSRYQKWLAGGGTAEGSTIATSVGGSTAPSAVSGTGWVADTTNPFRASTVAYGGVNITINGANVGVKELIDEIKRQLSYENIVSIIGAS